MEQKQINTVIVLRNDQTTNWESSAYKLLKGEVGIGYLENGNVIAKLGDGETAWKDLPQIEGVLEKEITLTHDFGRYKTTNGSVKTTDAAGKTVSEWLIHALSETLPPTVTPPSCSFSTSTPNTNQEIGEYISTLSWTGSYSDCTYEYGSEDSSSNKDTGISERNVTWKFTNNIDASQQSTDKSGSFTLGADKKIQLTADGSANYATITGEWTIDASNAKNPVNNIGDAVPEAKQTTVTGKATKNVSASSYRKAFYGVKAAGSALDVTALTSAQIRGLGNSTTSKDATPSSLTVPKGTQQVFIAMKKGLKTTLTAKDGNANDSTVTFTKLSTTVDVEGANNYSATAYDVWYVDWNPDKNPAYTGIGSAKALKFSWS